MYNENEINNFFRGKKILVTGGVGSIGSEIVRQLLKYSPEVVRVLDNNETGLFELEHEVSNPEIFRPLIGDIRDAQRLRYAMEGIEIVFHAAALKHVPFCEYNPFEAIKTNVIGTQNVIEAAIHCNIEKLINISTDKAAYPSNVMGATKLLAERLTAAAEVYKGDSKTDFVSVRFGNVLMSRGSVIPLFIKQIKNGQAVTVTDPEMTRFIMSIPEAVKLVFLAATVAGTGDNVILKMPAIRLGDLVDVLIDKMSTFHGIDKELIKIEVIGLRPGEKMDEELMTNDEAQCAREFEHFYIIPHNVSMENGSVGTKECDVSKMEIKSKNSRILSQKVIKELLETIHFED